MKNLVLLLLTSALAQNLFAGPFVAGGNGVMSVAYCDDGNGGFGATVNRDIFGKLSGYSWTIGHVSEVKKVKMTPAVLPGTPNEKPLIYSNSDFQIEISIGNLPAQNGAPIFRGGKVQIKTGAGTLEKSLSCTLYQI